MKTKVCTKCGEMKELSEYNRDGIYRRSECKICSREINKKYSHDYETSDRGKKRRKRYEIANKENNKQRILARRAVSNSIKKGALPHISTQNCKQCGGTAEHYHHHNGYGKLNRLDITPLCITCHNLAHEGDKNGR